MSTDHLAFIEALHQKVLDAEAAVDAAREARDDAIRLYTDVSGYTLAGRLGLTQMAISKIRSPQGRARAAARRILTNAGAPAAPTGPLSEWVLQAREAQDMRAGVLVGEDGTVLARTRLQGSGDLAKAWYVDDDASPVHKLEMGLARGRLSKTRGHGVIHIKTADVARS